MTKHKLPELSLPNITAPRDICSENLGNWDPTIKARSTKNNEISIYDVIGQTYDGEGVTLKRIDGALRSIGTDVDIVVNINSPGGSYFEGVAIYNKLRQHKGKVTVKILGMAASAASIISKAGDEILIGKAAEEMIHNAWGIAIGNSAAMSKAAGELAHFDDSMGTLYADRTGLSKEKIHQMMDEETYLNGPQAVELGFADGLLEGDEISHTDDEQSKALAGKRRMEYALKKEGMNDDEVSSIMSSLNGSQDETAISELVAADAKARTDILAGLNQLIEDFK